jgi:FAD:protein FMN transferase
MLAAVSTAAEPSSRQPARREYSEIHMGVPWRIVLYSPDETIAKEAAAAAFARVADLDHILSDYDPDSELSRLSDTAPSKEPIPVSDDLWRVLWFSKRLSEKSAGTFDITVGPLTKLWRRARRERVLPRADLLAPAREATDYRALVLDEKNHTAQLTKPHMRLDAGGIGVGFAVDEALAVLRKNKARIAMIDASGDIGVGDPPPNSAGWCIAIEPPAGQGKPSRYVELANYAITTSGDAFQAVEIDGVRYSHIVDPRTGLGLTTRMAVTVIAPDCITADSYTKPICVLGPEKGFEIIESTPGAAAYVELESGDSLDKPRFVACESHRFARFVAQPPADH